MQTSQLNSIRRGVAQFNKLTVETNTYVNTVIAEEFRTMGNIVIVNNSISGVEMPTLPQDVATKQYVDESIKNLNWKTPVKRATVEGDVIVIGTPLVPASGIFDGMNITDPSLIAGTRLLVKDNTIPYGGNPITNGIYVVAFNGLIKYLTRASDMLIGSSVSGAVVFVEDGATQADTAWLCTNNIPNDIVGTDPLVFVNFTAGYAAGSNTNIQFNLEGQLEGNNSFTYNYASYTMQIGVENMNAIIRTPNATGGSGNTGGNLTIITGTGDPEGGKLTLNSRTLNVTTNGVSIVTDGNNVTSSDSLVINAEKEIEILSGDQSYIHVHAGNAVGGHDGGDIIVSAGKAGDASHDGGDILLQAGEWNGGMSMNGVVILESSGQNVTFSGTLVKGSQDIRVSATNDTAGYNAELLASNGSAGAGGDVVLRAGKGTTSDGIIQFLSNTGNVMINGTEIFSNTSITLRSNNHATDGYSINIQAGNGATHGGNVNITAGTPDGVVNINGNTIINGNVTIEGNLDLDLKVVPNAVIYNNSGNTALTGTPNFTFGNTTSILTLGREAETATISGANAVTADTNGGSLLIKGGDKTGTGTNGNVRIQTNGKTITFFGNTVSVPTNENIVIDTSGTGKTIIDGNALVTGDLKVEGSFDLNITAVSNAIIYNNATSTALTGTPNFLFNDSLNTMTIGTQAGTATIKAKDAAGGSGANGGTLVLKAGNKDGAGVNGNVNVQSSGVKYTFNGDKFSSNSTMNVSSANNAIYYNSNKNVDFYGFSNYLNVGKPAGGSYINNTTFTASSIDVTKTWRDMAWNPVGMNYIAVGDGPSCQTSTDGITWSNFTTTGSSGNLKAVAYGNGYYYALKSGGNNGYYNTGGDWISASVTDKTWTAIAYSPVSNRFSACGSNTGTNDTIGWSRVGVPYNTWSYMTLDQGYAWYDMKWVSSLGAFIVVGNNGTTGYVMKDTTGGGWNLANAVSLANQNYKGVAWSDKLGYAVVVSNGPGTNDRVSIYNGTTLTAVTNVPQQAWYRVEWSNELDAFYALASSGNFYMTSPDGYNWTAQSLPDSVQGNDWSRILWSRKLQSFTAVSSTGATNRSMYSTTTAIGANTIDIGSDNKTVMRMTGKSLDIQTRTSDMASTYPSKFIMYETGEIDLYASSGRTSGYNGGSIAIRGGDAPASYTAGSISLTGGTGTSLAGGAIYLTSGASSGTSVTTGAIYLTGGASSGGSSTAGAIYLTGGASSGGSSVGGTIYLTGGSGVTSGGAVNITGGTLTTAGLKGADVIISGANTIYSNTAGGGYGGNVIVKGGINTVTGVPPPNPQITGSSNIVGKINSIGYIPRSKYLTQFATFTSNPFFSNGRVFTSIAAVGNLGFIATVSTFSGSQSLMGSGNGKYWSDFGGTKPLYSSAYSSTLNRYIVLGTTSPYAWYNTGLSPYPSAATGAANKDFKTAGWFNNGITSGFVALGTTGSIRIMTSPDGITWSTPGASPFGGTDYVWSDVAFNGTTMVAVGNDGTNGVMWWTEDAGATWTQTTQSPFANYKFVGIVWASGFNKFVITSDSGADSTQRIFYSDGKTYITQLTTAVGGVWGKIAYDPTHNLLITVASTATSPAGIYSTNLVDWSSVSGLETTNAHPGIAFGLSGTYSLFVALQGSSTTTNRLPYLSTTSFYEGQNIKMGSWNKTSYEILGTTMNLDISTISMYGETGYNAGRGLTLTAGSSTLMPAGKIELIGGSSSSTGLGGNVVLRAGASTSGTAGSVKLIAGDGVTDGRIYLNTATVGYNINGDTITSTDDIRMTTAANCQIVLTSTNAAGGANGGNVTLTAGAGHTNGNGGSITISPGVKAGGGSDGWVSLSKSAGGVRYRNVDIGTMITYSNTAAQTGSNNYTIIQFDTIVTAASYDPGTAVFYPYDTSNGLRVKKSGIYAVTLYVQKATSYTGGLTIYIERLTSGAAFSDYVAINEKVQVNGITKYSLSGFSQFDVNEYIRPGFQFLNAVPGDLTTKCRLRVYRLPVPV